MRSTKHGETVRRLLDRIKGEHIEPKSVTTEDVASDRIEENDAPEVKTWTQDGEDADERLSNAISAASEDDIIRLESATYGSMTTTKACVFIGTNPTWATSGGSMIDTGETWTLNGRVVLDRIGLGGTLSIEELGCVVSKAGLRTSDGHISIDADRVLVSQVSGSNGSITFEDGTSDGEVGLIQGNVSVTDNGDNSVLSS